MQRDVPSGALNAEQDASVELMTNLRAWETTMLAARSESDPDRDIRALTGAEPNCGGVRPSVSLVIPALNEAEGLTAILPRVPDRVDEIIVVDGGSTDGTVDAVLRVRPDARIMAQQGRGKGNALKHGLDSARGDILVTMDADGSMNPEDIVAFVEELEAGADFVKGSRSVPGAGSDDFTRLRSAGNTGLTRVANLIFRSRYTDITFGFNAYWRSTMEHLGELADGFEYEIQAALRASALGLATAEVPTYEPARIGGESKLNPVRDGWSILRIIMSEAADWPTAEEPLDRSNRPRRFEPGRSQRHEEAEQDDAFWATARP